MQIDFIEIKRFQRFGNFFTDNSLILFKEKFSGIYFRRVAVGKGNFIHGIDLSADRKKDSAFTDAVGNLIKFSDYFAAFQQKDVCFVDRYGFSRLCSKQFFEFSALTGFHKIAGFFLRNNNQITVCFQFQGPHCFITAGRQCFSGKDVAQNRVPRFFQHQVSFLRFMLFFFYFFPYFSDGVCQFIFVDWF